MRYRGWPTLHSSKRQGGPSTAYELLVSAAKADEVCYSSTVRLKPRPSQPRHTFELTKRLTVHNTKKTPATKRSSELSLSSASSISLEVVVPRLGLPCGDRYKGRDVLGDAFGFRTVEKAEAIRSPVSELK